MNNLVNKAKKGDKKALEEVVNHARDLVYNLSLKMHLFHEDAEDATQEILIRIITHLGSFEGKSKFSTWVYRIAINYLTTQLGKKSETFRRSFDQYAQLIDKGQSEHIKTSRNEGEIKLLEEEVKVSCTYGLLLCLDARQRMVYIIGEILGFSSVEAADMLAITPENFRKVLSRSRNKIRNFLIGKCGLINPSNACPCKRKIDFLVNTGNIDPCNLRFAPFSKRSIDAVKKLDHLESSLAIYRSVPESPVPASLSRKIKSTINLL